MVKEPNSSICYKMKLKILGIVQYFAPCCWKRGFLSSNAGEIALLMDAAVPCSEATSLTSPLGAASCRPCPCHLAAHVTTKCHTKQVNLETCCV